LPWEIESIQDVAVVRMTSNRVNKQNPDFFVDLMDAFDRLDKEHPNSPIVLTGMDEIFSVGIDFEFSFELFGKRDPEQTLAWFEAFRGAILRVFRTLRPTVAAVNGHVFAGGVILALGCDFQVARSGNYQCAINEVPVGIPMPSVYTELIRHRLGTAVATEAILTGRPYSPQEALEAGFFQAVVESEQLIPAAIEKARCVRAACMPAFEHSKRMLLAPVLARMETLSEDLDRDTAQVISSAPLLEAQRESLAMLRQRHNRDTPTKRR
jgi:enoyl-CoA hydratase